jgi:hypothetical protein
MSEPTIAVPVDTLDALLHAWSQLTAHLGRDMLPPEGDDAYDRLTDLVAEALS